jgi:hypothetical protein
MKKQLKLTLRSISLLSLLALSLSTFSPFALAKDPNRSFGLPAVDAPKEYQHHGDLVSIRIVPGDKETRLYLVGKEAASLKLSEVGIVGTLHLGDSEKAISFKQTQGYFFTETPLSGQLNLEIKLPDQKKEKFKIKLNKN